MITTNLDTSRKLAACFKKHGVEVPESYFVYAVIKDKGHGQVKTKFLARWDATENEYIEILNLFPSYTLDELLEVLPNNIMVGDIQYFWKLSPTAIYFAASYIKRKKVTERIADKSLFFYKFNPLSRKDISPADAAANLLIWVIENGHYGGVK